MLGSGTDKGVAKTAVLNADDPHWRYLADRAASARVLTYGIDAHADVQGTILSADAAGSRVRIATASEAGQVLLPLVGPLNVHNAVAPAARRRPARWARATAQMPPCERPTTHRPP